MTTLVEQLLSSTDPAQFDGAAKTHWLVAGASGSGKTYGVQLTMRPSLSAPQRGVIAVDPENDIIPGLLEYIAKHTPWRTVHRLDAASSQHTFGLPLLKVADPRDVQSCHDVAVRTLSVFGQVLNFGEEQVGPRISKLLYCGFFALARRGLPLALLPELYTSKAYEMRALLAEAFAYPFTADIWRGLESLSAKTLHEYLDPLLSRLLPIFSSPAMRAVFGALPHKNIDIERVLRDGDVVLLPLADLEAIDAKIIGSAFYSIVHHAALKRPLDAQHPVELWWDEIAPFIIPELASGFDRLRKRKVFLRIILQRLSQAASADDPRHPVLTAILSSARTKIIFGGLPPEDCEILARQTFGGHVNLDTIYKPGSIRPVVTGQQKVLLASEAQAHHEAEQHARASSTARSTSHMRGVSDAIGMATGLATGTGLNTTFASLPDAGVLQPSTTLTRLDGRNSVRMRSAVQNSAHARIAAEQSAESEAHSSIDGHSVGHSTARGLNETYATVFTNLATESFSIEEKQVALIGLLQALQPRACVIKIESEAPVLVHRTPDLTPPFKSEAFKQEALRLLDEKLARSPYLYPRHEVEPDIAEALAALNPPAEEPDFSAGEAAPSSQQRGSLTNLRVIQGSKPEDNDP